MTPSLKARMHRLRVDDFADSAYTSAIPAYIGSMDDRLDTRTAAALIGVSEVTLKRWRIEQKGPAYIRVGGKAVRYHVADVQAWMKAKGRMKEQRISTRDQA